MTRHTFSSGDRERHDQLSEPVIIVRYSKSVDVIQAFVDDLSIVNLDTIVSQCVGCRRTSTILKFLRVALNIVPGTHILKNRNFHYESIRAKM